MIVIIYNNSAYVMSISKYTKLSIVRCRKEATYQVLR